MTDTLEKTSDVNDSITNHDILLTNNDNTSKNLNLNFESNDSRLINPGGAQSPASSTYADCEENDESSCAEISSNIVNDKDNIANIKDISSNIENFTKNIESQSDTCSVTNEKLNDNYTFIETELTSKTSLEDKIMNENEENNDFNDEINDVIQQESLKSVEDSFSDKEQEYDEFEDYESGSSAKNYDEETAENYETDLDAAQLENDRENGDGEEIIDVIEEDKVSEKQLDDDEDRRNPQYIPKRGFFYEHDDRTNTSSGDETEGKSKKEPEQKENENLKGKNRRSFPDGKWQHDLYREDEQKPKSSQELIDVYGYDIRNEESAPKARRRRKYGRGPNKYTRKWDDQNAYVKQSSSRSGRRIPYNHEDYDEQFPALKLKKAFRKSNEIIKNKISNHVNEMPEYNNVFQDYETNRNPKNRIQNSVRNKYREKIKSTDNRPRLPNNSIVVNKTEVTNSSDIKLIRKSVISENTYGNHSRGFGHGKPVRTTITDHYESHSKFKNANRGRSRPLYRENCANKKTFDNEIQNVTEQMSNIDLSYKKRIHPTKQYTDESEVLKSNDLVDNQISVSSGKSKRYSQQRQRLLPEVNKSVSPSSVSVLPEQQTVVQNVQNIVQNETMCQTIASSPASSIPLITQTQRVPQPSSVQLTGSSSMQSPSLTVSGSLIQLPGQPLSTSGPALPAAAPPLPIMGFFQHPQGFTNQNTPTQLYSRDQTVIGTPSNQPVQLVAFLPASPMLPNTNHTQNAPPPQPPPPSAPAFQTTVMNYQQASQTQQTSPAFNSDSYPLPPVTLAPIPQPPEVYQSRGGVTYYNTRSQVKSRSPPPPRVKAAIPIVRPPTSE